MINQEQLDQTIKQYGFTDYKWIVPQKDIVVAQWVRFRCTFGCKNYGKKGSCPPAVPPVEECRKMIYEYNNAIIFHFPMNQNSQAAGPDDIKKLMAQLLELERDVFLLGYYKTFLLQFDSCKLCKDCAVEDTRMNCVNKTMSRPGADAMGIDVYKTARNVDYPIQVVRDHSDAVNRYAFLLIE
jgi:predicted metal-binding protein